MVMSATAIKINTERIDKKGPDVSLLRLYVPDEEPLPKTLTILCCSVPAWGWFVLITNLLCFSSKYFFTGGDAEVDMIFELLTVTQWYDSLLVPIGILNFLALVCFAVALIRKKSKYAVPYVAWQVCLTVIQTLLAIGYTVAIVTGNQHIIRNVIARCIIGFFTPDSRMETQMFTLGELTLAWIAVGTVLAQAFVNVIVTYVAFRTYKLHRYVPASRFRR